MLQMVVVLVVNPLPPWMGFPSGFEPSYHIIKFFTGTWFTPQVTGDVPPPGAWFSLTAIDGNRAILFGGSIKGIGWSNKSFILDMNKWVSI